MIKSILEYLYWSVYKIAELISFGLNPDARAALILSVPVLLNIASIVTLLGYHFQRAGTVIVVAVALLLYYLFLSLFSNTERQQRIVSKYLKASAALKLGTLWVPLYGLGSFLLFLKVMTT